MDSLIPEEIIERKIYIIRGLKVMLDSDLAILYGIPTKRLNEQLKRNAKRFPLDFSFQLTEEELEALRSQIATSKSQRGGRRYLPFAFTEHGVAMLSSILDSERAIQMNIFIIRAFIKMRELVASNKDLADRVEKIESAQEDQGNTISSLYSLVKQLISEPAPSKGKIGFETESGS